MMMLHVFCFFFFSLPRAQPSWRKLRFFKWLWSIWGTCTPETLEVRDTLLFIPPCLTFPCSYVTKALRVTNTLVVSHDLPLFVVGLVPSWPHSQSVASALKKPSLQGKQLLSLWYFRVWESRSTYCGHFLSRSVCGPSQCMTKKPFKTRLVVVF